MLSKMQLTERYQLEVDTFGAHPEFVRLERGEASSADYDAFLRRLGRTHLKSPHILAFLFSAAPPACADSLKHNLLEELGLEQGEQSHSQLLETALSAAGLGAELPELHVASQRDLYQIVTEPLLYGTLRDVGLAVFVETVAFEFMLSRMASRIADYLHRRRGLPMDRLTWFTHHSEVDIAHAEEGLNNITAYVDYYAIDADDAQTILDTTLRENVFVKRYFGELALATAPR